MISHINSYTIILTEDCNLRCKYCYVEKEPHTMSLDTAKLVMDYICNNTRKHGDASIDAFGGEPLLNLKVLKYIIQRSHEFNQYNNYKIDIMIFTNGILFTKEFLEFTHKFDNVMYNMSQDGCEECHNTTRFNINHSGSFKDVIKGSELFKQVYGFDLVKKFMLSPDNMKYLPDTLHYMLDNNIHRMSISIVRDDIWTNEAINELQNILKETRQIYIDNIDNLWIDLFTIPIIDYTYKSKSYCSAGKEMIGISPDGGIYPCQRFYNMDKDKYRMGDVVNGINESNYNYLLFRNFRIDHNLLECKKCDTFEHFNCVGQCMASCENVNGTFFKLIPGVCSVLKVLYNNAKEIYNQVSTNENYIKTLSKEYYGG